MKFWFFVLIIIFSIFPHAVFAHGSGFPPFFKVDGKITEAYPLQNAGAISSALFIPQDVTEKNYQVGEEISFEIDASRLETVFPPEVLAKANYSWEFGDGEKAHGLKNSHQYKKAGTQILKITMDVHDFNNPPQVIESLLLNIVPNNNYKLPQSSIKINGKSGSKESYNILDIDLNNSLTFDGAESKSGSSEITKYVWDFGDDKSAVGKTVKHQYVLPQAFATVILRTYDKNGFFTDAYINIRNSGKNDPSSVNVISQIGIKKIVSGFIIAIALLFIILKYK